MSSTIGIIVLEGPDCSGKTTLAKKLCELYDGYYMHLRVHKDMWKWHTAALRLATKKSHDKLVVLDRHWPSEGVYGPVFRGKSAYSPHERSIDRVLLKHAAIYVLCCPRDIDWIVGQHAARRGEGLETFKSVREVASRYIDLWDGNILRPVDGTYVEQFAAFGGLGDVRKDWVHYDLHRDGKNLSKVCKKLAYTLQQRRWSQYPPALRVDKNNVLGHIEDAKFLFIGEEVREPGRWCKWPFYSRLESAAYLNECLHKIAWNEASGMWTNALADDSHVSQVLAHKKLKVVTLGKVAERLVKVLNILPHATLPHPQWARRFNHHGDQDIPYWELLRSATQ
jgi:hypothetical protein